MNVEAADPPTPTNPLRGRGGLLVELLESLNEWELREYCRYWSWRPDQYGDNGFATWKCSNLMSAGKRELRRRQVSAIAAPVTKSM